MPFARVSPLLVLLAGCLTDHNLVPVDPKYPNSDPEPEDYGRWLSLDAAPDDERLVMAAYDKPNDGLIFGVGTFGAEGAISWRFERVDGYVDSSGFDSGDRGTYASMKVAPDGSVWIAYYDATAKNLRWAHREAGGPATFSKKSWTTGVIDEGPDVGTWASLALDVSGAPVVAYHDEGRGLLKIARVVDADAAGDAVSWTTEIVAQGSPFPGDDTRPPSAGDVGEFARLLIQGGTEFVAFYDRANGQLLLAEGAPGSYNVQPVSPGGGDMGQWPSLLWDANTLHVAYHDVTAQALRVSSRTPGGWTHEVADNAPFVGADTEFIKRGGRLAVAYFDGQNNDMKFAAKAGSVWVSTTVMGQGVPAGFFNELVQVGGTWYAGSYDFSTKKPSFQSLPNMQAAAE